MYYWLKDYPDKSILPSGVNTHLQIDENGQTAVENAQLKLKAYYEVLNMPVIAADSGMCIDGMFAKKAQGMVVVFIIIQYCAIREKMNFH